MKKLKTLGERIAAARKHLKMTQIFLAMEVGLSQKNISAIEKNKIAHPGPLKKIADVLRVTEQWLLFGTGRSPLWHQQIASVPEGYIPILKTEEIMEWHKNGIENLTMDLSVRDFSPNLLINQPDRQVFGLFATEAVFPVFKPGSVLIAEKVTETISGSYVIAQQKNDKLPIFRKIIKDGSKIYLTPINPHYPHATELSSDFLILAEIVAWFEVLAFSASQKISISEMPFENQTADDVLNIP